MFSIIFSVIFIFNTSIEIYSHYGAGHITKANMIADLYPRAVFKSLFDSLPVKISTDSSNNAGAICAFLLKIQWRCKHPLRYSLDQMLVHHSVHNHQYRSFSPLHAQSNSKFHAIPEGQLPRRGLVYSEIPST